MRPVTRPDAAWCPRWSGSRAACAVGSRPLPSVPHSTVSIASGVGSTHCVFVRRRNSVKIRSIAFVVRRQRHCAGGKPVYVVSVSPASSSETTTALHFCAQVRRKAATAACTTAGVVAVVIVRKSRTTAPRSARGTQAIRFRSLCTRQRWCAIPAHVRASAAAAPLLPSLSTRWGRPKPRCVRSSRSCAHAAVCSSPTTRIPSTTFSRSSARRAPSARSTTSCNHPPAPDDAGHPQVEVRDRLVGERAVLPAPVLGLQARHHARHRTLRQRRRPEQRRHRAPADSRVLAPPRYNRASVLSSAAVRRA